MITFYLMNEKGYQVLLSILDFKKYINCVVSSADKNVTCDYYEQIKKLCMQHGITFYDRKSAKIAKDDYKIAIGWRWLIEDSSKLIILHDSLLPKYRGFAPLVNALINGETKIGVTALFANSEYDEGNIIKAEHIHITYPIKIKQAIQEISTCYINLAKYIMLSIINDKQIDSTPQIHSDASYSIWRDELDYYIDWSKSSEYILNCINALGEPYQGAKTILESRIITIEEAITVQDVVINDRSCQIGKVIFIHNNQPVIICGQGLLQICNAYFEDTKTSILPLNKFRVRFGQSYL